MKDAQKAGLRGHVATNVAIDTPVGKLKDATQLSETDLRFYMKRFGEADTTKTSAHGTKIACSHYKRAMHTVSIHVKIGD